MDTLLQTRHLETWYGPIMAMQGVNIEVRPGQIVTVLGANGAGKTTLLHSLSGVIDPFKGEVEFLGQRIEGLDPDEVCRRGLRLVPEGRQVFPFLSVRDNLMMGAFTRHDSAGIAQDLERIYNWFPRLRERESQHAGLLSGGEQQMLVIGRAVMGQPRLLLLDEPSLGLSPLLTREIFSIVRRIRDEVGMAILVVEQNASLALKMADYGYIMELGRVVAADTCTALMQKPDVQEAYLGMSHDVGHSGTRQRWTKRKTWR